MHNKQAVLILSGYNIRAVIAFCRWATQHEINYHIIAKGKDDPIFLTSYKNNVFLTRNTSHLCSKDFYSWYTILCNRYNYQRIIILPSSEYLNRFLLKYRSNIENDKYIIPLVNYDVYTKISDKKSFVNMCKVNDIQVPEEYKNLPKEFPFVAKPYAYLSRGKQLRPYLVKNKKDLKIFLKEEIENFFFQEYIKGESYYILAYIDKNKDKSIVFSQKNLMQQACGGSILLATLSNFHKNNISNRYISMLYENNYRGLIMVEVRKERSSGKCYMIEANPRLWGPLQFIIDNKVSMINAMFRDLGFKIPASKDIISTKKKFYFWSGGITKQSLPIMYHSPYSADLFKKNYHKIRSQDIYFKEDTLNLYIHENNKVIINEEQ